MQQAIRVARSDDLAKIIGLLATLLLGLVVWVYLDDRSRVESSMARLDRFIEAGPRCTAYDCAEIDLRLDRLEGKHWPSGGAPRIHVRRPDGDGG